MLVVIVALSFMCILCVQRQDSFVKRVVKILRAPNKLGRLVLGQIILNQFSEAKLSQAKARFSLRAVGRFA